MSRTTRLAGSAAGRSDAEAIEHVLSGERDAYRVLVGRYQKSLLRVAFAMVGDRDVAEDLVQDAFVRAYVNLARVGDRGRFRVWLFSILRNRALDHLKEKRRQDVSLSNDGVMRRAEATGRGGPNVSEQLALREALDDALARLSPPLREAFVLRHVEGFSLEETARLLGAGVSAVKMRIHRARSQLQEWLTSEGAGQQAGADRTDRAPSLDRPAPGGPGCPDVTGAAGDSSRQ